MQEGLLLDGMGNETTLSLWKMELNPFAFPFPRGKGREMGRQREFYFS